jgi:hypothetical protein
VRVLAKIAASVLRLEARRWRDCRLNPQKERIEPRCDKAEGAGSSEMRRKGFAPRCN